MTTTRIGDTTFTVYAELLDQLRGSAAIPRSGSFVSKVVAGSTYWYVQRVDGGRKRQFYLGAESPELLAQIERADEARAALAEDEKRRRELVSMLVGGGMAAESAAVSAVLSVLAECGLFHAGAVLVGMQAFSAIANLLGARFDRQSLRTAAVDIGDPTIAVGVGEMRTDILEDLRTSDPRFIAVPELDASQPSTSFNVRGRDLRVDLLTPATGASRKPVFLPHLRAAALPMPGLQFLIAETTAAAILSGPGVLVNVPSPARFAIHKLWVAQQRNASELAKARKDVRQAAQVLDVLLADGFVDVERTWRALPATMLKAVRRSCATLDPELRERLAIGVQDAALSRR